MNHLLTKSALKYLTTGVRRFIRAVEYGRVAEVVNEMCWKDGKVWFRLRGLEHGKGKKSNHMHMKKSQCDCVTTIRACSETGSGRNQ